MEGHMYKYSVSKPHAKKIRSPRTAQRLHGNLLWRVKRDEREERVECSQLSNHKNAVV